MKGAVERAGEGPSQWNGAALTCARLIGWQHGHKHMMQEERAAVHPDGARQQATEVVDITVEKMWNRQWAFTITLPWTICSPWHLPHQKVICMEL